MVIRRIKERHWAHVYGQITRYGRAAPLSLQYDIDVACNGVSYILKIQPEKGRRIAALQALGVYPGGEGDGRKELRLIEDNALLSALLEIIVYQGAQRRET